MKTRLLTVAAVVIGISSAIGAKLWWDYATDEDRIVRINNTRFFQWSRAEEGEGLVLNVKPNPQLPHMVSTPPVPRSGRVVIVGKPGTTDPGAIVNISNQRTGQSVGAYADESGGFSLTMTAEEGDDLKILAMKPPRIIAGPEPVYVGLEQQPDN